MCRLAFHLPDLTSRSSPNVQPFVQGVHSGLGFPGPFMLDHWLRLQPGFNITLSLNPSYQRFETV